MSIYNSKNLLAELTTRVGSAIKKAEELQSWKEADLRQAGPDGSWSPVQHLHHLNFYADFYTNSIEQTLAKAKPSRGSTYRTGWLGNYFTNIIGPAAEAQPLKMKMKTPANGRPPATDTLDVQTVIEDFLSLQKRLLSLLQRAQTADLGKNRVTTALGSWLRLKLGDTFRFVVAHQERHFQHIERGFGKVA